MRKRIFILGAIICLCFSLLIHINAAESYDQQVQTYLDKAKAAMEKNDLYEAKKAFEDILAIEPRHFLANYNLGRICIAEGLFQKAVDYLTVAREVDEEKVKSDSNYKRNPDVLFLLGLALQNLDKYNEALVKYQFALTYGYIGNEIYYCMALCYAKSGQKESALKMGDKYLEEKGLIKETAFELVTLYTSAGYYLEASAIAQKINIPEIWHVFGEALVLKEQYEMALSPLNIAIEMKGDNDSARFALGYAYYELNKMDDAIQRGVKVEAKESGLFRGAWLFICGGG